MRERDERESRVRERRTERQGGREGGREGACGCLAVLPGSDGRSK